MTRNSYISLLIIYKNRRFKKKDKKFKVIVLGKNTQKQILRENNEMLIKSNFPLFVFISVIAFREECITSPSDVFRCLSNLHPDCFD